jgi:hypothetical protein
MEKQMARIFFRLQTVAAEAIALAKAANLVKPIFETQRTTWKKVQPGECLMLDE